MTKPNNSLVFGIRPRCFRMTIRSLLLIVFLSCFVLSRYYPRVATTVTVDVGAANAQNARVACVVATSPAVYVDATNSCNDIQTIAPDRPIDWLRDNITANVTPRNEVQITLVGDPKNYKRRQRIVEAVAEELIKVLPRTSVYNGTKPSIVDRNSSRTVR